MAEQPAWLGEFRASEEHVLQHLDEVRQRMDGQISMLGQDTLAPVSANADASMPEAEEGTAVAVSDGGLFIDRENANLAYLGNVRVRESRLQLRCVNRLYMQFPASDLKEGEKKAKDTVTSADEAKAAPATPAAKKEPRQGAAEQEPLIASAFDAMVDIEHNHILMRSHGAEGMPHLKYGENELTLAPMTDGSDTYLLADHDGDAHMRSGGVTLHWTDNQGRTGSLIAGQGRLEFNRASNTLYIEGPSQITMPDGSMLSAQESLCVTLHEAPGGKKPDSGVFMAQFSSLDYDGVEKVVACGNVVATRPAADGQPAAKVCGGTCTYNGSTGECSLAGENCRLVYGDQELRTQDSITLAPNGDITIHGGGISGTYALPSGKTADGADIPPVLGTFRTSGDVRFNAADGTVTVPNGLQAEDATNHFTCTGPLVVQLKRTAPARTADDRSKTGMLNLAVADYGEVVSVEATGGVDLAYTSPDKGQSLGIQGDLARFNLEKGTAHVSATQGHKAELTFGQYILTAQGEGGSTMSVDEQGNLDVAGDTIHAELPFQKDSAVVDCHSHLRLNRQASTMELGPGSKLAYPQGIMTANGPISAKLAPGDKAGKPADARYPHLTYNFSGVEKADTQEGGTLRTEKASMECNGPISISFAPAPAGSKPAKGKKGADDMGRITARASGGVAILAKDGKGKLMRATGDTLVINGETGTKILTGHKVTLADQNNIHTATGRGACVTVDRNNNARITGERQVTTATRLQEQMPAKDKKKP